MTRMFNWRIVFKTMGVLTTLEALFMLVPTFCAWWYAQTHSILLWRALMQWIGGMGIIVLSVAILPMFGLGGMQLYSAEVTGVSYEKLSPRIADTAKHMWITYIGLTAAEGVLLWLCGMGKFDAVCHALSTISTGGFATHNDSVISFGPAIQWIILIFMLLSGINFTQLIYLFRGKPQRLLHDEETRWYISACLVAGIVLAVGILPHVHRRCLGFHRRRYEMGAFRLSSPSRPTRRSNAVFTRMPSFRCVSTVTHSANKRPVTSWRSCSSIS